MAHVPASYIKNKKIDWDGELFAVFNYPGRFGALRELHIKPPSIGVMSALEMADSMFVKDFANSSFLDFLRAIYICAKRREALEWLELWLTQDGRSKVRPDDNSTYTGWEHELLRFAEFYKLSIEDAPAFYEFLLGNTFNGYEMIPKTGGGSGEYLFDAATVAAVISVSGRYLNLPYDAVIWDVPLCLIGHIAAVEAEKNGTKGVGRPKDPDDIKLQCRLANEREARGELHPWQIKEPHMYPLSEAQIKANPNIKKEYNRAMKEFLRKQREKTERKEVDNP